MTYQDIIYEKQGRVARITLNRPEKLNALGRTLLAEMEAALIEAEQDDGVGVIILKGAGRAFCAGYDLEPGKTGEYAATPAFDRWAGGRQGRMHTAIWDLRKPVIAQVHGYCVAGGLEFAGQCDIIIAAENAMFMHPTLRRLGLAWVGMIVYNAGPQQAKLLTFTGDPMSGKEAERIGLVAKAVPEGELEEEVNKLAERIALMPAEFLALNKAAINRVTEEMGMANAYRACRELDIIARTNGPVLAFRKMVEEKGWKAALAASEAPFNALPKPFEEKPNP